jgi:hypothetical protein
VSLCPGSSLPQVTCAVSSQTSEPTEWSYMTVCRRTYGWGMKYTRNLLTMGSGVRPKKESGWA